MWLTDFILGNTVWAITLISLVLNIVIIISWKYLTDQEKLKHIREEMKKIREEMKEAKNDPQRMAEINKKSMEHSGEQMKQQFKPMLITLVPFLIIFGWLRSVIPYDQVVINFPFNIWKPGLNDGMGWFGIYFITAMVFSTILRKIFKVY